MAGHSPLYLTSSLKGETRGRLSGLKQPEKWVRVGKWGDADDARRIVLECIERAKTAKTG